MTDQTDLDKALDLVTRAQENGETLDDEAEYRAVSVLADFVRAHRSCHQPVFVFVLSCMEPGPTFYDGGDTIKTSCGRHSNHTMEHEWWNDEGNIRLIWREGWHFGNGSWRDAALSGDSPKEDTDE